MQKWFLRLYSTHNFENKLKKLLDADPVPWSNLFVLNKLFKTRNDKLVIKKYIPALVSRARNAGKSEPEAVNAVGDFSVRCRLFNGLPVEFKMHWINTLAETNPLRAISIWKLAYSTSCAKNGGVDTALLFQGVQLYIQTNQIEKAEEYASKCEYWPAFLVRQFYIHYTETKNAGMAASWLRRWPAPTSADLQWASAAAAETGVLKGINGLEAAIEPQTASSSGRIFDKKTLGYIKNVNAMICVYNLLEIDAVLVEWRKTMTAPTIASLDELVSSICQSTSLSINESNTAVWTRLFRSCSLETLATVLRTQRMVPAAYAVYLGRIDICDLPETVKLVPVELLYTQPCLTTLARRSPELFAQIAVNPDLMDAQSFEYKEVHLLSLWTQVNTFEGLIPWLFPLSLQFIYSEQLLRVVLKQLLYSRDMQKVFIALYYYLVVYNQPLSPQFVESMTDSSAARKIPKQRASNETFMQTGSEVLPQKNLTDQRLLVLSSTLDKFKQALNSKS